MRSHDCVRCEHEELTRPVWLLDRETGQTVPVGKGCAAHLLGGTGPEVFRRWREVQDAADQADRIARQQAAAAENAQWFAWLDTQAPEHVGNVFEQIQSLGGFAAAKARYAA